MIFTSALLVLFDRYALRSVSGSLRVLVLFYLSILLQALQSFCQQTISILIGTEYRICSNLWSIVIGDLFPVPFTTLRQTHTLQLH